MSIPCEANSKLKHEVHYVTKKSRCSKVIKVISFIILIAMVGYLINLNHTIRMTNERLDIVISLSRNQSRNSHQHSLCQQDFTRNYQILARSIQTIKNQMDSQYQNLKSQIRRLENIIDIQISDIELKSERIEKLQKKTNVLEDRLNPNKSYDSIMEKLKFKFKNLYN